MLDALDGNGVSDGTGVKVGCTVGAAIVAVGVSNMVTAVGVAAKVGGVALGGEPHAARTNERSKIMIFFI